MDDTVAKQLVYYLCVYPHSPKPNIRISICDKRHLYTGILNLVLNKRKTSPQAFSMLYIYIYILLSSWGKN